MRDIFHIVVMLTFVVSLLAGFYFWIRASLNRRRPSQRGLVHTTPLNALLFEDELLPEGLKYRAKAIRTLLIAFISLVVALLLG